MTVSINKSFLKRNERQKYKTSMRAIVSSAAVDYTMATGSGVTVHFAQR